MLKNHTLGIAISAVPYYKDLNNYTGSVTATILMTQLEYWFSKMKGERFFKFLEPCDRKDYKEGDSWVEELGFTKYEFRTAFAKIGKAYKSKKEYLSSQNQFEGKPYLSYRDRAERRTYYIRNHEDVDKILDQWISKKSIKSTSAGEESQLIEIDKVNIHKSQKSTSRSGKSQLPLTEDYNRRLQQKTTAEEYTEEYAQEYTEEYTEEYAQDSASNSDELTVPGQNTDTMTDKKVVELFNLICPSLPKVQVISNQRKKAIRILWKTIKDDNQFFEKLFHKVEQSDFLCGRFGKWKASFDWVIKQGNAIKIMEGNYDNHAASTGHTGKAHSLTDQLTSQAVQDFINN